MICDAIYKKVDENQEDEYRSFHILAEYLISQGITGIAADELCVGRSNAAADVN